MTIKSVAIFHCGSGVGSAWNLAQGIIHSFAAQGYDVLDCGDPRSTQIEFSSLQHADMILMSALEWYWPIIQERYGQSWLDLPAPKVAWYAESSRRDDHDFSFGSCKHLADFHYYPAIQDAEEYGGQWLPFGTDTEVFRPSKFKREIDAAFLGTLYPARMDFCRSIDFPIAYIPSVSGATPLESAQALANAYCYPKIFVNLPALSRLLVAKITEVMACGTMILTPSIDHPSGIGNMKQFENNKHLIYYDVSRPKELGEIIQHYINHPDERKSIARAGFLEVISKHTLHHRVAKIVSDLTALSR